MFRKILLSSTLLLLSTVGVMADITVIGGWDPSIKHKIITGSIEAIQLPKGIPFILDKDNQKHGLRLKIADNIQNLTLQVSGFVGGWLTNSHCTASQGIQNDGAIYWIELTGAKTAKRQWASCTLKITSIKNKTGQPKP